MKKAIFLIVVLMISTGVLICQEVVKLNDTLTHEELKDKIKGAWAAQTIGVTFGSPVEFKYNGTMIQDYQTIPWYDGYLKDTYDTTPGFYIR